MLTTFFTLLFMLAPAHGQTLPRLLKKDRAQAAVTLDYFSSTANYGAGGGTFKALPDSGSFQNVLLKASGSYELDNKWKFFGGLTGSMVNAQNDNYTHSASELTEFNMGAHYWLMRRPFWLIPVFKYTYPLQRVSDSTTGTITGEGAMTFDGGTWISKKMGWIRAHGYLGLKYQDEGRASLIPWIVAAEYRPQFWFFSGGLRGSETLQGSADSHDAHLTVVNRTNAGSLRYYGVNPSSREIWGESGLHWQNWQVWLGIAQTFNGQSSASGFTATIGGLIDFDLGFGGSESDYDSNFQPYSKPAEKFKSKTEKYDHSLFEESSPDAPEEESVTPADDSQTEDYMNNAMPSESATADEPPVEEKPKKKPAKKKKKKVKAGPSTEQMLDETQKKLEEM